MLSTEMAGSGTQPLSGALTGSGSCTVISSAGSAARFSGSLYQAGEHQQNINQFHKDKGSRQTAQTINKQVP